MPTKAKERRIVRLALALAALLLACSAFFLIPAHPVKADDPSNDYPSNLASASQDSLVDPWNFYNRECTSFVAWRLNNNNGIPFQNNNYKVAGTHFGSVQDWGAVAKSISITVDTTPATGAVAWWYFSATSGHVAWVTHVNSDGSVVVQDYNWGYPTNPGQFLQHTLTSAPTGYIHFKDLSISGTTATPAPAVDNIVLAVKKLTQSDGTNEVFWAKGTNTFETWWRGNSGPQTSSLVYIPQGDIKAIDAQLIPDGLHLIYTATTNYIWQTAWYPGQQPSTGLLLHSPGNIRVIQKTIGPDGVTHQMYVLTDNGVSEYWWSPTSNGIQGGSLYTLANAVAMYKTLESNGTQALYIADANYAYAVRWGGGLNGIQVNTLANIGNITALSFSQDSDGKHHLYIGSNQGEIWEVSWYTIDSYSYWHMAGGAPVVALQKWESDSTQVLYEATSGGVFEFYWPQTSYTLQSDTIVGGLGNVHAFVRATDPGGIQSVYTATGKNVLETWWIPGGNGPTTGTVA